MNRTIKPETLISDLLHVTIKTVLLALSGSADFSSGIFITRVQRFDIHWRFVTVIKCLLYIILLKKKKKKKEKQMCLVSGLKVTKSKATSDLERTFFRPWSRPLSISSVFDRGDYLSRCLTNHKTKNYLLQCITSLYSSVKGARVWFSGSSNQFLRWY